jgi:hypothetical protein
MTTRIGTSLHHSLDPRERPAALQGGVDLPINGRLFVEHALQNLAEKPDFGRLVLIALDLAPHPVGLKFRENVVEPLARDFHLIERLHNRQTGVGTMLDAHARAPI